MEKSDLREAFAEFKNLKNIDRPIMMGVIEEAFRKQLEKVYTTAENFDIIVNTDKGQIEIYQNRDVVEEVEDPNTQISLEEVNKDGGDYEIGESFATKIELSSFGRRGILNIRQTIAGKISDIERANTFQKYQEKIGQIFSGEVHQTWSKEVLVLDEDGSELHLPKEEQIPGERFRKGDPIRAIIKSADFKNNIPRITLSRTSDDFLAKLFEKEVPEIYDGMITVKKVVRIPGERAKVAVESYDERIDPIGACIGIKGARISGIVRELRNENIDVISWTNNMDLLIRRALAPALISHIDFGGEGDKVKVYMNPEEIKKGIGKNGCNVHLAGKLIGREIEVWRDSPAASDDNDEEDVLLDEFSNEIDQWVIDNLKAIGLDTAKSVLALDKEDVAKRADLDDETVNEIYDILQAEFED